MLLITTLMLGLIIASTACGISRDGLSGLFERKDDVTLSTAHQAFITAINTQGITLLSEKQDVTTGVIKGRYADSESLTVRLIRFTENATEIRIQVGAFGNTERSELLYTEAKKIFNAYYREWRKPRTCRKRHHQRFIKYPQSAQHPRGG